ncbi:MAG: hypothetical protein AAGB31_14470 [Bdellovibrio sp.]
MARILIATIPHKMNSYWDDELHCVVDCWTDFHDVQIADIERVILNQVIPFVIRKECTIHIVDNSLAHGAFSREISEFFKLNIGAGMAKTRVKYLVSIVSIYSPLSNMSMKGLEGNNEWRNGIYWIEARNLDEALEKIRKIE